MTRQPLQKGALICDATGRKVWATSESDFVLIEYADASLAHLAGHLCTTLLHHGVRTAYREHYAGGFFVAINLASVGLRAAVRVRGGETHVSLLTNTGAHINRQQAERLPGLSPKRVDCVIDDATHAGRVLRAHLALAGMELVEAQFRFGALPDNSCMMDAVDPLACRFWDTEADQAVTDYGDMLARLGGKVT